MRLGRAACCRWTTQEPSMSKRHSGDVCSDSSGLSESGRAPSQTPARPLPCIAMHRPAAWANDRVAVTGASLSGEEEPSADGFGRLPDQTDEPAVPASGSSSDDRDNEIRPSSPEVLGRAECHHESVS